MSRTRSSEPGDTPAWVAVRALFDAVADLPAAQRAARLADPALDARLVAEVRSLLDHHDAETRGVLSAGAVAVVAAVAAELTAGGTTAGGPMGHPPGPPPAQAAADRLGERLGPWRIVGRLGSGGMGEVWLAERDDGAFRGQAAIKVLKRGMDSAAVLARFAQEQQALARLAHPHIARLLDAGRTPDGLPYFVMERVEGEPIDRACAGRPLEERLQLFLQLADAVAHAHRNLLVHRDLKPGNVLVDGDGRVKLLDFGIAKALDPVEGDAAGQTQLGERPFTPHYASPEQVRGEPVTTATDVYSLGVLLYVMLAGTRPYGRGATSVHDAARAVLDEEPVRPSSVGPADADRAMGWTGSARAADPALRRQLRGDLDNIVLKALQKPVARRYPSVDAMAADVRAHLAGFPVSARAVSPAYVLGKFVRRHRWAVGAGSLGGIGLAMGLSAALLEERVAAVFGVLGLAGGLGLALWRGRAAAVARDLAESRLAATRAIVSDVMVRHADAVQWLPGGVQLKAELLSNMIGHLDRLAADGGGTDGAFAGDLAMAYTRLAELGAENGMATLHRSEASDAQAAKALALFAPGEAAHARNPMYYLWWGRAWRTRAMAARARGDLDAALGLYAGMGEAVQRGLARHPDDSFLLAELGSVWVGRAQVLDIAGAASLGRTGEALAAYAEAEALYERLWQRTREQPGAEPLANRHQLATVAGARLLVLLKQGRPEAAIEHGLRAVAHRRANVASQPANVAYRTTLATEASNLGVVLLEAGDAVRALEFTTLARETCLALERDDPQTDARSSRVALGLHHGRALRGAGRAAEALPVLAELTESPVLAASAAGQRRIARARLERAGALLDLGRRDEARVEAEAACAAFETLLAPPGDIEGWLLLAQAHRLRYALADGADGADGAATAAARARCRSAHAGAVALARALAVLNPVQERMAAWG